MLSEHVIVPRVLQQHVEEAATLYAMRAGLLDSAQVRLRELLRLDARLSAHLNGLAVAGEQSWRYCEVALEKPAGDVAFAAGVRAIESGRPSWLDRLFATAE
jgi:hypothetical protein